jgi:hypothetical protein
MSFIWRNKLVEAIHGTRLPMLLLGVMAALATLVVAMVGLMEMDGVLDSLPVVATPTTPGALSLLQMHLVDNPDPSARFASKSVTLRACVGIDLMKNSSLILVSLVGRLLPMVPIQIGT